MASKHFLMNDNLYYAKNDFVKGNTFFDQKPDDKPLPVYEEAKKYLPRPIFDGHEDAIRCYDKVWQLAFKNLRKANPDAGFVSDFIDTAFNGYLFMWDSTFIMMFCKYGSRAFPFQKTLDNFYSHQHKDGFISREICESQPGEQFTRDDPASTGPNVLAWAEWLYYRNTADKERLARVFDPLCGYYRWLRLNRSWQDGSYYSCGLACGMDNQPRQDGDYDPGLSHGFMSWIDTCAQQYLSARILISMAKELGREADVLPLEKEAEMLRNTVNDRMWSEEDGFYYDRRRDGSLSGVKTIGAYWTLLAGLVPEERLERFVGHLDNENEFKRPTRVPSLSADHPLYDPQGGYWKGGVWAPTNYMVLEGLRQNGFEKLAYEIGCNYLDAVVKVFNKTGTVFENYAPESAEPGKPAKADFVGWTGIPPVCVLLEYVLGIVPDAHGRKIVWKIRRLERHGVENYPLGDATVNLVCERRSDPREKPVVHVVSNLPVTVEIEWDGGSETIR